MLRAGNIIILITGIISAGLFGNVGISGLFISSYLFAID